MRVRARLTADQQASKEAVMKHVAAEKRRALGACTDGELDVALVAYAHAERAATDHEAALRCAVDKVLELRRWRRREEREAAQQPVAAEAAQEVV